MFLDDTENLKGHVVLINPYIHKKTNLTKQDFIERVSCVKEIRTVRNSLYLSFYIDSFDTYNNLRRFFDLVRDGIFEYEGHYVFAIAIQPKLYNWFKTTEYTVIEKQITFWLASLYFFIPEKRHIMKDQLYKPLFEEIENLVDTYYSDFALPDFKELNQRLYDNDDETIFGEERKCKEKYLQLCKSFYNSEPPEFLHSPFEYDYITGWGINEHFGLDIIEAYFLEKDWEYVILNKGNDSLRRAESRPDLWEKWKHVYSRFDKTKNFKYGFYYPNQDEVKPLKKIKREVISQEVKDLVWKRDEGKCVECGSNQKLEFDHIIPVVKGGSSTYRNIQLLCEVCNRKKHSKLGE